MLGVNTRQQVQVTVQNVQTMLDADDVNIQSNNLWTDFLLTIIEPFIMNGIVADIRAGLESTVETQLGPALGSTLNSLAIDKTLVLPSFVAGAAPIEVQLVTAFSDTDFHDGVLPPQPSPPQGGAVEQSAGGYAVAPVTPYDNLGVPGRVGCGVGMQPLTLFRTNPVEIALGDDLLNQILFSGWRGGLLEFPVTEALLGGGNGLIEDLDILASGMLAPTATDCNANGELLGHIGDLHFDASLTLLGTPVTFTAYSTMVVRLEIAANGPSISIGVSEVVDIKTELTIHEDAMINSETVVRGQLELAMKDAILDRLGGDGLGGIDLPRIDLSIQLGLPVGTAGLEIFANGVQHRHGTTVVEAHL